MGRGAGMMEQTPAQARGRASADTPEAPAAPWGPGPLPAAGPAPLDLSAVAPGPPPSLPHGWPRAAATPETPPGRALGPRLGDRGTGGGDDYLSNDFNFKSKTLLSYRKEPLRKRREPHERKTLLSKEPLRKRREPQCQRGIAGGLVTRGGVSLVVLGEMRIESG